MGLRHRGDSKCSRGIDKHKKGAPEGAPELYQTSHALGETTFASSERAKPKWRTPPCS